MEAIAWQWSDILNDYFVRDPRTGGYFVYDHGHLRPIPPPNTPVRSPQSRSAPSSNVPNTHDISAAARHRSQGPHPQASIELPGRFGTPVSSRDQSDYQRGANISQRPQATPDSNIGIQPQNSARPDTMTDPVLLQYGIKAHRTLSGTADAEHERLNPDFKLRKRHFFSVGRVFLVLWMEPAGANRNASTITLGSDYNTGLYGEPVHSKVRRFVVIREGGNYCSALPITTYRSQGVSKKGIKKSEHAVVYTGHRPPASFPAEAASRGEQPMLSQPIRVVPDDKSDALDPHSRIDFGKVHTVQHNIKAKAFGIVHPESMNTLLMHFRDVWIGPVSSQPASRSQAGVEEEESESSEEDGSDNRAASSQRKSQATSASSRKAHVRQDIPRDDSDNSEEDSEEENWDPHRDARRKAARPKSKVQDRRTRPTVPGHRSSTARQKLRQADNTEGEDDGSDDDEDDSGYLVA